MALPVDLLVSLMSFTGYKNDIVSVPAIWQAVFNSLFSIRYR